MNRPKPNDGATKHIAPLPIEGAGQRIGPYKLLQKIGEGGCGGVYMAEQEHPVRRRVALKVIKLGMDTREVIARFSAERQALAMMDHPNIAKVFDAGASDTGRPFFVMELVRGVSITRYCDEQNLSTADRLRLFILVCHAVQHAHQKGVIHRDLKPSNILVTLHDGVPVPKVIDFGIAKATQDKLTDATLFTAFEQFVGTPAYMSPEQAEMSGLDIDTRSDVYSLGVLLYELLTGRPPFDPKSLVQAGLDEVRRIICEVDPPRPSAYLTTLDGETLSSAARHRQVGAAKLAGLVYGDLDWIVMRCLEKDRARRYETASALALDLQRHLNDELVSARPPGRLYRFQKLVRRNKLVTAATATVIVALIGGLAFSTWAYFEEQAARRKAVTAEKKSEQITAFLQTMLGGARPSVALGKDTALLRDMIGKTAERLGRDLRDQPDVEANLRTTLGSVYLGLGDLEKAETMQREALALRRRRYGDRHEDVAASLTQLALVLEARADLAGAEEALREALAIRRTVLTPPHALVAATLNDLAVLVKSRGELAAAEVLLREAIDVQGKSKPDDHATLVTMLGNLGTVQSELGLATTAEATALVQLQRWFSTSMWTPARRGLQRWSAEVEATLWDTISLRTKLLDGSNLQTAWSRQNLAALLLSYGDLAGAEMLGREALDMVRHIAGPQSRESAASLGFLTGVLLDEKKFAAAETAAREGFALREKSSADDWRTFYARSQLGAALHGQQKNDEAGPLIVAGAEGLLAREKKIFPASGRIFLGRALRSAVGFFETTGDAVNAATWRVRLDAFTAAEDARKAVPPAKGPP